MYKEHDWRSIDGWFGRRRCQKCFALGYMGVVIPDGFKKVSKVYEYKCPKCHCATTKYKAGKALPCPNCRYPTPPEPEIQRMTLITDGESSNPSKP